VVQHMEPDQAGIEKSIVHPTVPVKPAELRILTSESRDFGAC